jgi:Bivalent Mical/EHBP Rab binding domain
MVYFGEQEKCAAEETNATKHSVSSHYYQRLLSDFYIIYVLNHFREQESDLERKHDLLNLELRAAMSVEDWRKTEEQRDREKLLLAELVAIVDKRNELVLNLHSQEQA